MKAEFVSVREAAQRRGVSLKAIYDLLWAGRIPGAEKVGKVWRVPAPALKASERDNSLARG